MTSKAKTRMRWRWTDVWYILLIFAISKREIPIVESQVLRRQSVKAPMNTVLVPCSPSDMIQVRRQEQSHCRTTSISMQMDGNYYVLSLVILSSPSTCL